MKSRSNHVLVLGAGHVGAWVARGLAERGCQVFATTTNPDTARALACLGVTVNPWRWTPGCSWSDLHALHAETWCVTVPPRHGMDQAMLFHEELHLAARDAGVKRLIWTSSTAVYDPNQAGGIEEEDAGHFRSRHTGVDMLGLEEVHALSGGDVEFVAMRFGGLFSERRHPVQALLRRPVLNQPDGHVQWVHERDAAQACVLLALHADSVPRAVNVVAPEVATRRELLEAAMPAEQLPEMGEGGVRRKVMSNLLSQLGMTWSVPCPRTWVKSHAGITEQGSWEGPHGSLSWTKHSPRNSSPHGRALMLHGYKGFRDWGNFKGVAEMWAREGWEVHRMDFSHNGHLSPFDEDCLDEEAWSANRYHIEVEEVAFALRELEAADLPLVVMGHSRGGAMAVLGANLHQSAGGKVVGVALWAPVSDVFARFPAGDALESWRESDSLEVVNGRTGQVLVHPFGFYEDAASRRDMLDVQTATRNLDCPVLVVHGEADLAVDVKEGQRVAQWARTGTWIPIGGADHVFGMVHPWDDWSRWPDPLQLAWTAMREWIRAAVLRVPDL